MTIRRDFYVYIHRDSDGNAFYVGKGTGRRAWSTERHSVWHKYTAERLEGRYTVEIHREDLTEPEAEALEDKLIAEFGEQLVNWINPRRQFDYEAINDYHRLRNENKQYIEYARGLEASNLAGAIECYRTAMQVMRTYEAMTLERGLVAELRAGPKSGDPDILNRLTLCLQKLGRHAEVVAEADRYFAEFPAALWLSIAEKIGSRVKKSRIKAENGNASQETL